MSHHFYNVEHKLNIWHSVISAGMIMVMFLGMAVMYRIAPFGDHTFLMFDMKRQYVDFYAYLRSILQGDGEILYSFSTTLGSGMLGFWAYYLTSPLLLILCLFPKMQIPIAITVLIGIKLMLASFFMDLFLQRFVCKKEIKSMLDQHSMGVFLGASSWGFCGFLVAHSMNMMWIEVVILFPVLLWTLEYMLETTRKIPYILCLTFLLYLNYYMTYQVLIFTALWTLYRVFTREDVFSWEKAWKQGVSVLISTLIAPMIGGILLIPTAISLQNSPKDLEQQGLQVIAHHLMPRELLSKMGSASYDSQESMFGSPQLFCGVLMLLLVILYFMNRQRSRRERIGMAMLFGIMIISFCVDFVNLFWHAGMEPSGHPYRQAFCWIFLVILCGVTVIEEGIEQIPLKTVFLTGVVVILLLVYGMTGNYEHITSYTYWYTFVPMVLYVGIGIATKLLARATQQKTHLVQIIPCLILFIHLVDLTLNAGFTYGYQSYHDTDYSLYRAEVATTSEAVAFVKQLDDSFYRMEDYDPREQNDGLQYGYNGVTHYSSAGMVFVRNFLQRMGFNDDGLMTDYGSHNTMTADSLLGIKYVLSNENQTVHDSYYQLLYDQAKRVYYNPYALPVAVGVSSYDLSHIAGVYGEASSDHLAHVPAGNPFVLQEDMYARLLGRPVALFREAEVWTEDLKTENGKMYRDFVITPSHSGELYFYMEDMIGEQQALSVFLNGTFLSTYGNAACIKILNLGSYQAGETLRVSVVCESKNANLHHAVFVTEDADSLEEASKEVAARGIALQQIRPSHLTMNAKDAEGVFLSIPCEKGWKFYVDGKNLEPVSIYDALLYLPLLETADNATPHQIEMKYVPPGLGLGLIVSCIGLILLGSIVCLDRRKEARKHEEEKST